MAVFPWVAEKNFETGLETGTRFTDFNASQTDTDGIMDVVHYSTLATSTPNDPGAVPYSGAYCGRLQLDANSGASYFVSDDAPGDFALNETVSVRFRIYFGADFTATAADDIDIMSFETSGTDTLTIGIHLTSAGVINFQTGQNTDGLTNESGTRTTGQWYTVEAAIEMDAGGGNDGSINLFVTDENGYSTTTAVVTDTGLDQTAITSIRFGVQNRLSTTTGMILLNDLYWDAGTANVNRFHSNPTRWNHQKLITAPGHLFVGPGRIDSFSLLAGISGDGNSQAILYDTDTARIDDPDTIVASLNGQEGVAVNHMGGPLHFRRGCFVDFQEFNGLEADMGAEGSDNPRAMFTLGRVNAWGSPGSIRNYAARRGGNG